MSQQTVDPGYLADVPPDTQARWRKLADYIGTLGSAVVAFSGGVDSAVLLAAAVRALGPANVLAATGRSPSLPSRESDQAALVARELGALHQFVDTRELADERYSSNPSNRCYFCKDELYARLTLLARERGLACVLTGTIVDDLGDHRPGLRAAAEHTIRAPLVEAGLTKADVRAIAHAIGLSVADKPASPCLASRVPYGEAVTLEKLRQIDQAEALLHELGFANCRVRHHGTVARIEVPADQIARLTCDPLRSRVDAALRELGFQWITVDLRGLRSGSLNEVLVAAALQRSAKGRA